MSQGTGRLRPDILLAVAATALVVVSNLTPIYENDFWIQLKVGDIVRDTGTIPRTVLFACTEAKDFPFVAHEWLPSVASSALYARVGYAGMIVVKCTLALVLFALSAWMARRQGADRPVAIAIAGAILLAINFRTQMRPEIFGLIFFAASLLVLDAFCRSGRVGVLVGLVPIMLGWANSHGSFLVGLALPFLVLAGAAIDDARAGTWRDRARHVYVPLALAPLALAVVSLVNPYGYRLHVFAMHLGQSEFMRENMVEFAPTLGPQALAEPYGKVAVVFAALVLLSFWPARRRLQATPLLLTVVFGALALQAIRFTVWFAVAAAFVLGANLAGWPAGRAAKARLATVFAVVFTIGAAVVAVRGNVRGVPMGFANWAPLSEAAIGHLRATGTRGAVFNSFRLGDQLVHDFWPGMSVTIDSRVDAYGPEYYLRYRALSGRSLKALGPSSDLIAFLDRYRIDTIVSMPFDYRNWTLRDHAEALRARGWIRSFEDDSAVILVRTVPPP